MKIHTPQRLPSSLCRHDQKANHDKKKKHHDKSTCDVQGLVKVLFFSFFVRQRSNRFLTHGARGRLDVPAGFRAAVTVECDLLCVFGAPPPLAARLLCHDSVGRLFMRVSNCICGRRWCQSGCPVAPLPSAHPPLQRIGRPFVAVIVRPATTHRSLGCAGSDERL